MTYTCVCVCIFIYFLHLSWMCNFIRTFYRTKNVEQNLERSNNIPASHWKLFKKSCPLSCFTEIYSPFEKSIVLSFLDVHFYTKFQRSRSIFGRCNDRLVVQSLIVSPPPPPGSHSDNFSPISVIFSGKGNKKREEEEWNTRSIPKWQIRKDPFPQNLIDSSFVKLLQNSRDRFYHFRITTNEGRKG